MCICPPLVVWRCSDTKFFFLFQVLDKIGKAGYCLLRLLKLASMVSSCGRPQALACQPWRTVGDCPTTSSVMHGQLANGRWELVSGRCCLVLMLQGCHWRLQGAVPRIFSLWMEKKQREVMLVIPYQGCCAQAYKDQGFSSDAANWLDAQHLCLFGQQAESILCCAMYSSLKHWWKRVPY